MKDFLNGLSKWPLLLGAILCFAIAVYEETVTDNSEVLIGVAGAVLGSMLLGAWIVLFVIDFERRWHREHGQASAPPATGETQDGAEESEPTRE